MTVKPYANIFFYLLARFDCTDNNTILYTICSLSPRSRIYKYVFYKDNNANFIYIYAIAVVQLPDMKSTPFSNTDSPMMHMVGATVSGVMYFSALPTSPANTKTIWWISRGHTARPSVRPFSETGRARDAASLSRRRF